MATPFQDFVNIELPKRINIDIPPSGISKIYSDADAEHFNNYARTPKPSHRSARRPAQNSYAKSKRLAYNAFLLCIGR